MGPPNVPVIPLLARFPRKVHKDVYTRKTLHLRIVLKSETSEIIERYVIKV